MRKHEQDPGSVIANPERGINFRSIRVVRIACLIDDNMDTFRGVFETHTQIMDGHILPVACCECTLPPRHI